MAKRRTIRQPKKPYTTGAQISVSDDGKYASKPPKDWRLFDEMVTHPTIRLAIRIVTALAVREPWTVEGGDDEPEYARFQQEQLAAFKRKILRSALQGIFKRGWRAMEVRYGLVREDVEVVTEVPSLVPGFPPVQQVNVVSNLRQSLDGFKPLKNERTQQVLDKDSGEFLGVAYQELGGMGEERYIDKNHVLFVNDDDEGFGEYGTATLQSAVRPYRKWIKCDDGAERYDDKVAGGFRIVKYPVGNTPYDQNNDEDTSNALIAEDILRRLRSSGDAKIPTKVVDPITGEQLKQVEDAWKIEHVAAQGGLQPNFVIRGKYLDALMMRVFGLPERSATEGTLGTKAEAEAHADISMMVNHETHERIVEQINEQVMQPWNEANKGDPHVTRLTIGDLDTEARELFTQIFTTLMADPVLGDEVSRRVDVEALLDKLDVPVRTPEELAADERERRSVQQLPAVPPEPAPAGPPTGVAAGAAFAAGANGNGQPRF